MIPSKGGAVPAKVLQGAPTQSHCIESTNAEHTL